MRSSAGVSIAKFNPDPKPALWRLVQTYVNSPRIMGKTLGLQPLTIILALMAGGHMAGIPGVFLSVPTAAVLRIAFLEFFDYRNSSVAPAA